MVVPLLPESAPFSPAQRAWLNGFFAGLLNFDANGHSPGPAAAGSDGAMAAIAPAADEEEEFPWHDPTLAIEERITLAEGKPAERKLMAAMAQLDCGACGYLCQTYSEAIARGEEKDLTKCTPGGKPTSKMLKELLAAAPVDGAARANGMLNGNGAVAKANGVAKPTTSPYNRANPFPAKLIECRPLNRPGSVKDTRHVMISLAGSGLTYEPGDALGVYPENCPELADEIVAVLGASLDTPLAEADGRSRTLRDALIQEYALARPPADLIEVLAGLRRGPGRRPAVEIADRGRRGRVDRDGRRPGPAPPIPLGPAARRGVRPVAGEAPAAALFDLLVPPGPPRGGPPHRRRRPLRAREPEAQGRGLDLPGRSAGRRRRPAGVHPRGRTSSACRNAPTCRSSWSARGPGSPRSGRSWKNATRPRPRERTGSSSATSARRPTSSMRRS